MRRWRADAAGHRLDVYKRQPYDLVERHEHRANKWAIEKLLPRDELYALYADGLTQPWEIAEHAALPEDFVRRAMAYYHDQDAARL